MIRHLNLVVNGLVQGVFFRQYTLEKAKETGVCGFVMNRQDNTVYIEAEGDEKALALFVEFCYKGSPASRVDQVITTESEILGFPEFIIKREIF